MDSRKHPILDFIRREYRKLAKHVRKILRDAADRDAEDVVQDVILGLIDSPDLSRPVENVAAWVYRSIRNRVTDHYRRKWKAPLSLDATPAGSEEGETFGELLSDPSFNTHGEAEKNALGKAIREAVESLPEEQKAVFVANEMDGRTFGELSEEWKEPVGTLLARKHRAVKALRSKLAGWRE